MDIKDFINITKNHKSLYFIIFFIFTITSFVYSLFFFSFQKNEFNFYIQKRGSDQTTQFKYDQYYSVQNIANITKLVANILKDPIFVGPLVQKDKENYVKYKIDVKEKYLGTIGVKILSRNKDFLSKIPEDLRIGLNNNLTNLRDSADQVYFQVINSDSNITRNPGNFLINILIFNVFGLALYLIIALIKSALEKEK